MNDLEKENQESPNPADEVKPAAAQETPEAESRLRRFFKLAVRWVIGLLIVFGLGALVAMYTLYIPNRRLAAACDTNLQKANQTISGLEQKAAEIPVLENKIENLREELRLVNQQVKIYAILSDVNVARLALGNKDPAGARFALTNTEAKISELVSLVKPDQQEAASTLLTRFKMVLSELDTDVFAAQSDLEVLATNLGLLDQAVLPTP